MSPEKMPRIFDAIFAFAIALALRAVERGRGSIASISR